MSLSPFGFDHSTLDWVLSVRAEPWNSLWQMVTVFGDTLTLTLVAIGVFVLAWVGERIDLAALIAFGGVSGYLVMVLLKSVFGRARPPVADRLIDIGSLSFPSGHAMMSTVIFGLTAVIVYRLYVWVRLHPGVLLLAPGAALIIGASRVYLGAHWASDVLAGWALGLVWLALCLLAHKQIVRWVQLRTEPPVRVSRN
ncbi:phosphatase PAP2 family protein [Gordonia alkaliphila]|uniref:Phosphatidic acid phosphatase type 2/haloperoxidase domain-containing protein n=1 Tax=Gordonia alkaliphila TaxID=1053547 RepID=A0ABP8YSK7_9ACTN|nr:phosphatase PAP2 family protein [Gordonia alkaliphila]MCK0439631.1 phosphatase PAP2 family protein [Gordonia alkaliphila]